MLRWTDTLQDQSILAMPDEMESTVYPKMFFNIFWSVPTLSIILQRILIQAWAQSVKEISNTVWKTIS